MTGSQARRRSDFTILRQVSVIARRGSAVAI
jgi:hypothetical protein